MDGVHDLGGREGFGPIVDKADDKAVPRRLGDARLRHQAGVGLGQSWTIDWFRHCRELTDPVDYLTRPYFDQWLTTLAAQMIDEGYLTLDEIKRGAATFAPKPSRPPQTAEAARASVKTTRGVSLSASMRRRASRLAKGCAAGSTAPPATRACPDTCGAGRGIIHAHHGGHVLPDASARGEERGEHLYTVSFASSGLWPEAKGSADRVFVDLWESYLEPA